MEVVTEATPQQKREKLEIFVGDGWWWASQGVPLEEGYKDQRLAPSSTRLSSILETIEERHPGRYIIFIDPTVTKNPFVKTHILSSRSYGMTPDYNFIQQALDHPASERCTRCGGEGWYNGRVGCYECFKCGAHEISGEFMKIRRRF